MRGFPLLSVAVTLMQKVSVSGVFAIGAAMGSAEPVQLGAYNPVAAFWVFQLVKSTKKRVFAYVPEPDTAKPPPGVCAAPGFCPSELGAAFGTALSAYPSLLPGSNVANWTPAVPFTGVALRPVGDTQVVSYAGVPPMAAQAGICGGEACRHRGIVTGNVVMVKGVVVLPAVPHLPWVVDPPS